MSRTQSFQQNHQVIFHAFVPLKLLESLISCLVACSARIVGDKQIDRDKQVDRKKQIDRQTDRQTHRPSTVTHVEFSAGVVKYLGKGPKAIISIVGLQHLIERDHGI